MVNAGMNGNAQDVVNAGMNSAGTIASGYDAQTGATIQNTGNQLGAAAGQIQNGNYVDAVATAG